ncbi:MAG: galactokinase, partial [Pauljensenia sp.]
GFGGSAIALVDAGATARVASAIARAYAERGWEAPHFIRALPSQPAGRVN